MDVLDWFRALAALAATLALIGLGAFVARRLGMLQGALPGQGMRRMRVSERLMLDPRRSVVIVRVDGEEHVLLLSPFGEKKLARIPAAEHPTPMQPTGGAS
jgi:flagellar protein FliO/FliZ